MICDKIIKIDDLVFLGVKMIKQVLDRLKDIDPLKCTPMDAINLLYELKELSKK